MALLLRNPDLVNRVDLLDLAGTFIAAGDEITLNTFSKQELANSLSLTGALNDGLLILSNGIDDYKPGTAISMVRGLNTQEFNDEGRPIVLSSTKPKGTVGFYTGRGDDIINNIIGQGSETKYNVQPNASDFVDLYFLEDVQFDRGIVQYINAKLGSWLQMEIIAPPGYPFPNLTSTGALDLVNGSFVPSATGTGAYDIDIVNETIINRYVNHIHLLGSGEMELKTPEPGKVPVGYCVRITVHNDILNTVNLECIVSMLLFRSKTM